MSTPGFLEIQLDPKISYGTKGGLSFNTLVVASPNRSNEIRYQQQNRGYWNLSISLTNKSKAQMQAIQNHFEAVRGKTYGWRFRNWRNYQATNQAVPLATNTVLQLLVTRTTAGVTTVEYIRKPDMTLPITLMRNTGSGFVSFPSAGNWTLDTTTGLVTFSSSQAGNTFTWSGQYDMAARFDTDDASISWTDFDVFDLESIAVREILV